MTTKPRETAKPALPRLAKSHRPATKPPFERVALLLQGGGALGSYQAGVYQALDEAGLHPDWIAGISIGAINSAIIAGNEPKRRVERLRRFWETVTESPFGIPSLFHVPIPGVMLHRAINQARANNVLLGGAPGFFRPRFPPPYLLPDGTIEALSFYDVAPLRETLQELVDFDLLNDGRMRFSVGAVNVRSGNFVYFDNVTHRIRPDHVMASGSLPPGFPPTEIEGEYYWDGGLVSNTPLQWVLDSTPRVDTLAFQVDLWSAQGEMPGDLVEQETRQKEIRYSSRTRMGTDQFRKQQKLRRMAKAVLARLPSQVVREHFAELTAEADETVFNIVQLIYHAREYEGNSKDYEFSRRTMEEHWTAGYNDAVRTLRHPEVFERPTTPDGVFTFDLARQGRE